jgi:hypothetical protein
MGGKKVNDLKNLENMQEPWEEKNDNKLLWSKYIL